MPNKSILCSLLAVAVSLSALPVVHAQDRDQGRGEYQREDDHRGQDRHDDRHADRGRDDRRDHYDHHDERGAGPEHEFHRGDRLPPEFHHHQYVVDNWREHRLNPPPRGYHWVQNGGDYMLVAIGTGVIMQLIFGN